MTAEIIPLHHRPSRARILNRRVWGAYRLARGIAEVIGWITIAGLVLGTLT